MQPNRYLDIRSGKMMVVSDLHGDGEAFDRCVQHFVTLRDEGEVDRLLFLGDLIHGYGSEDKDQSLRMVLELIDLQKRFGQDNVLMLLGNHEMPHIYGVSLAKGEMEFTPRFERALGDKREQVIEFFKKLPFVARTGAGVMFCHAGPDQSSVTRGERLRSFDHDVLLSEADRSLAQQSDLDKVYETYAQVSGQSYAELAKHYLAVEGKEDPRYSHLMRALFISERDHRFGVLWDFLFTQNERGLIPAAYEQICQRFLDSIGMATPVPQRVCVSGHIAVQSGGHQIVNERHFRLASATHARPREKGQYLLLDTKKSVSQASELVPLTRNIF